MAALMRARDAHRELYRVTQRRGGRHAGRDAADRRRRPMVLPKEAAYRSGSAVAVLARIETPR